MPHVEPDPTKPQKRVRGFELRRRMEVCRSKFLARMTCWAISP